MLWRFLDGKPGHQSQSRGLAEALARRVPLDEHLLDVRDISGSLASWLRGRFVPGAGLPRPDLMVGAGHRTHVPMLAARRAHGGRVVVLMRPSLPLSFFDCAVIPRHDRPLGGSSVIETNGVLNAVRPAEGAVATKGLILIGGPSKHHGWDEPRILAQVRDLIGQHQGVDWQLTTSRRTPRSTVHQLESLTGEQLRVVPFDRTEPGWVAERLQECGRVWVSEDSVSMVFEALTACSQVGLLSVPLRTRKSRVADAVAGLKAEGRVLLPGEGAGFPPHSNALAPLAEADRVAGLLLGTFPCCPKVL